MRVAALAAAALTSASLGAGQALAQAAPPPDAAPPAEAASSTQLGEIIVTAQRRAENLQNVGVSVTAFNAQALDKLGVKDSTDLAMHTPGLRVAAVTGQPSIVLFNLRGVNQNDFGDHQESPIAVYADDAYVGAFGAASFGLYDLERVEVLKGPQGTLFGRNATGGLIQFISAKPTFDPSGYAQVSYGSYNTVNAQAAVGGPLTDTLAGRISVLGQYGDGYIRNAIGPDAPDVRTYAMRGQLLYRPRQGVSVLAKAFYSRNDDETTGGYTHQSAQPNADGLGVLFGPDQDPFGTCGGCDRNGYRRTGDPFHAEHDYDGRFNRDVYGLDIHAQLDLGSVTLHSITDWLHVSKTYSEDSDQSPLPVLIYFTGQDYDQYSQEFRLSGGRPGKLNWTAGVYLLDIVGHYTAGFSQPIVIGTPFAYGVDDRWATNKQSAAIYVQADVPITDTLSVTGGLRYTYERVHHQFVADEVEAGYGVILDFTDAAVGKLTRQTDNSVSFKAQLNWRPWKDVLLYTGVTRGHKGPGFSAPLDGSEPAPLVPFKPEDLTNYESGFKTEFWDRRARLNGSVFVYDYTNYQAFSLQGLTSVIVNTDASVVGAEAEFTVAPANGLTLMTAAQYLDTKVDDIRLPSGRVTDTHLPQAPRWTLNLMARKELPLGSGVLGAQLDGVYTSRQNFGVFDPPDTEESGYGLFDARLDYAWGDGRWLVAFAVHNLFDRTYRTWSADYASSYGFAQSVFGKPRTFSAELTYRFK